MPEKRLTVLVVDDEPAVREVLAMRVEDWGHDVVAAADADEADAAIRSRAPDVVISDVVLPGTSGLDLLRRLKGDDPGRPVILITAHGSIDAAVEAMKGGAQDFLTKPLDYGKLRALLEAAAEDVAQRRQTRALESRLDDGAGLGSLVGQSRPMRELFRTIELLASSDASAIITGESGTGKEVVARTVHELSSRRNGPFIAVNAAAIPEGLIESELFGHEKGAFTGAVRSRPGCFELAHGGTLFLDEIAEMPAALQPKLLRILEDGRARRLGGDREISFDVRVLAATNRPPATAVRSGRLREKVTTYDFKRPERVGKEQMRALQTLHEGFGRNFGAALSALLRTILEVKLTSVDQLTYSEFIFSLENPTCFNLVRAKPLEGYLILDINPSILYPIIDRLLGGGKESGPPARRPRPPGRRRAGAHAALSGGPPLSRGPAGRPGPRARGG